MVQAFKKRQVGPRLDSVFEFNQWKRMKALILPDGYVARNDYESKEALAEALGLLSTGEMFVLLPTNNIIALVRESGGSKVNGMFLGSAALCCVADLYNLLEMMRNLPPEQWSIYGNGTHGTHLISVCFVCLLPFLLRSTCSRTRT